MDRPEISQHWRTNLLLTGTVLATLVAAFLLAQLDALQMRLPSTPSPLLAQLPTGEATAVVATNTPQAIIALPSSSATSPPMPTDDSSPIAEATATLANGLRPPTLCGEVPPGWSIYTVRPEDTLFSLAAFSGATIAEISRVNCLQNGLVTAGMRIYLPVRRPTAVPCGPPRGWVQVRIAPGDTLFSLALRHNTSVYAIMQANCLSSTQLFAGRFLFLPPLRPTAVPTFLPTLTPTLEPTTTPTLLPSLTPTAVFTPTLTSTPILTSTPTAVPSPTATPAITATLTAAPSPTPSPSATPGDPATPSATAVSPTSTPPPATPTLPPPTETAVPPTPTQTSAPPMPTLSPTPTTS